MSREGHVRGGLDDEALLGVLSDAARETAAVDAGAGPTPGAWHRLQARRARGSRPPWRGLLVAGAGVAAVLALVIVVRGVQRTRPLTYVIADGPAEQDGYIRGGSVGSQVQFSDGTHVDVGQGARVSVLSRGPRGARLRVEEGEARFNVAHLPRAAWSVEAGPYVVYVTGTVFDVRWSGTKEVIEVHMRSGSVQIGGPLLPERVTLRGGQHLTAKLASGELHIDEMRVGERRIGVGEGAPSRAQVGVGAQAAERPAAQAGEEKGTSGPSGLTEPTPLPPPPPLPSSQPAPPSLDEAAREQAARPAPAEAATVRAHETRDAPARPSAGARRALRAMNSIGWTPRAWSSAIITGNAARVLAEAEAHGLDKTLVEVDSPALVALADASRYSGRPEVAVRALVAERQRFPDTPSAHAAAFLLGRLADDRGEVAAGLAWYRRYLNETPQGPYAAEALGRKMLAVERLSGRDAARSVAAQYVDRFPNGTYMLQAHAILANPTP